MTIAEQLQDEEYTSVLFKCFKNFKTEEGMLFTFFDGSTLLYADGEFWRDK